MSNVTPTQIFQIVSGVYGTTLENMSQRTCGCFKTMPRHIEARGMAIFLTLRHTQETRAGICRILGFKVNGEARTALLRQATVFAGLVAESQDLRAIMEQVEDQIDQIHEASLPPAPPEVRRDRRKARAARIKDLPPVDVGEMTDEWWRVNDMKFRRALLDVSEYY